MAALPKRYSSLMRSFSVSVFTELRTGAMSAYSVTVLPMSRRAIYAYQVYVVYVFMCYGRYNPPGGSPSTCW